jgi:hypothetical protein
MTPAVWISLIGALTTFAANAAGYLVGWGVMRATLGSQGERIKALEGELSALSDLKVEVAKIATRQDMLIEQFRDLNASIRWIREPLDGAVVGTPRSRAARP